MKQVVPVPLPCCARAPGGCPCPAIPPAVNSCFRIPGKDSLHLLLPGDPTLRRVCSLILDSTFHKNAFLDSFKDVLGTCNPGRKAPGTAHFQAQFIERKAKYKYLNSIPETQVWHSLTTLIWNYPCWIL